MNNNTEHAETDGQTKNLGHESPGDICRRWRKRHKVQINQLAGKMGRSQSWISLFEATNYGHAQLRDVFRLCKNLDIPFHVMFKSMLSSVELSDGIDLGIDESTFNYVHQAAFHVRSSFIMAKSSITIRNIDLHAFTKYFMKVLFLQKASETTDIDNSILQSIESIYERMAGIKNPLKKLEVKSIYQSFEDKIPGEIIQRQRNTLDISGMNLAATVERTQGWVSRIENNAYEKIQVKDAIRLCQVLELPFHVVFHTVLKKEGLVHDICRIKLYIDERSYLMVYRALEGAKWAFLMSQHDISLSKLNIVKLSQYLMKGLFTNSFSSKQDDVNDIFARIELLGNQSSQNHI